MNAICQLLTVAYSLLALAALLLIGIGGFLVLLIAFPGFTISAAVLCIILAGTYAAYSKPERGQ
jgi:hypothetical protein